MDLAAIVRDVTERPEQVSALSAQIVAERDKIVMPLARHVDAMAAIYAQVIGAHRPAAA